MVRGTPGSALAPEALSEELPMSSLLAVAGCGSVEWQLAWMSRRRVGVAGGVHYRVIGAGGQTRTIWVYHVCRTGGFRVWATGRVPGPLPRVSRPSPGCGWVKGAAECARGGRLRPANSNIHFGGSLSAPGIVGTAPLRTVQGRASAVTGRTNSGLARSPSHKLTLLGRSSLPGEFPSSNNRADVRGGSKVLHRA